MTEEEAFANLIKILIDNQKFILKNLASIEPGISKLCQARIAEIDDILDIMQSMRPET